MYYSHLYGEIHKTILLCMVFDIMTSKVGPRTERVKIHRITAAIHTKSEKKRQKEIFDCLDG